MAVPTLRFVSTYAFPFTCKLACGSAVVIPTLLFNVSTNKWDEPTLRLLSTSTFPEKIWLVVCTIYIILDIIVSRNGVHSYKVGGTSEEIYLLRGSRPNGGCWIFYSFGKIPECLAIIEPRLSSLGGRVRVVR